MMMKKMTAFSCKACGGNLQLVDDRELFKILLWCEKCDKLYGYSGPNTVEVPVGTDNEELIRRLSGLYLKEL